MSAKFLNYVYFIQLKIKKKYTQTLKVKPNNLVAPPANCLIIYFLLFTVLICPTILCLQSYFFNKVKFIDLLREFDACGFGRYDFPKITSRMRRF